MTSITRKNAPTYETMIYKETGEIADVWVLPEPERYEIVDKELKKNRDKFLKEKPYQSKFNTLSGGFTFTMMKTLKDLIVNTVFTPAEKTRIMFLGTYVSYNKETPYLTHSNGRPLLKNQLQQLLGMTNRKEFYAFYNKLVTEGVAVEEIINRNEVKLIWSNQYHFKGKAKSGASASKSLVKTYDNQVRELYLMKNDKGKALYTAQSLFNIYTLLPYIHPESNVLCRYPDKPAHASEPFTLQDLATLFNIKRTNDVKRMLLKIKLHDMPVVAISETSDGTNAFINPFLVNRTGKTPNVTLFTMFSASFNKLAEKHGWNEKDKDDFLKGII